MASPLLAGIEAGGTKFVCGVGRSPGEVLRTQVIPTTSPTETLAAVIAFLRAAQAEFGVIAAIGAASFGPLDLDPASPGYGRLANTPKAGWAGFDLRGALAEAFGRPVALDTDVAGAGIAEQALGAGQGLDQIAYVTVGTGIGGALIVKGRAAHGAFHAEMGHIPVRRHVHDADFAGICPFHGDCLEGVASGPSVVARSGARLSDLPAEAPIWAALADYIAQLCLSLTLIAAPQRIVIGGGVMSNAALYPLVRRALTDRNRGYLERLADPAWVEAYVTPPGLGDRAGLTGALILAEQVAAA